MGFSLHVFFLELIQFRYPWYVDVRQQHPNGITIQEIIHALWVSFNAPIEPRHYWTEELTNDDRSRLDKAYFRRCGQDVDKRQKGITRGDFLGMHGLLRLDGLVRGRMGMWEMKIGVYGSFAV